MKIDILIPTYKRKEKLKDLIDSLIDLDYIDYRIIILPDNRRMRCMALINEGFKLSNADAVLPCSDDMRFDRDSLKEASKMMADKYPDLDGVIGLKQLECDLQGALLLIGSKFLDRFPNRQAFCPDYVGLWADWELWQYSLLVNKFSFCDKAKVNHYHPAYYPDRLDETHSIGRKYSSEDVMYSDIRKAKGLLWGKDFVCVK